MKHLSWTICLMLFFLSIAFSVESKIDSLDSQSVSDITDNDEIYHSGQLIKIIATDSENRTGLTGTILITSQSTGYTSGEQNLVDEDDGSYSYLWDTANSGEASDYIAEVELAGDKRSLEIALDNIPPTDAKIVINNNEPSTTSVSVRLNLSAQDATEMRIRGDVVDDVNTYQWIPYAVSIQVSLTAGYKEKKIHVQFRDEAENVSEIATATINFEQTLIFSQDADAPTDDDEIYHAGQSIQLTVNAAQGETILDGKIQIKSQSTGYASGAQKLDDVGGGAYTYLWNTTGLQEAEDYTVNATLQSVTDTIIDTRPLTITIDNDPPTDGNISINNDEPTTSLRSVSLAVSAQGAAEMFIEGELVDDTNTFEWISYTKSLLANLTEQDGEKEVRVRFRDAARNESGIVTDTITLDRAAPSSISILIEEDKTHTKTLTVTIALGAKNAEEMFIRGDVVNNAATYQWIPYSKTKTVRLTSGDGEKRVKVKFRNAAKIESEFVEDTIILDLTPPGIQNVLSQDADNPQDADNNYYAGQRIEIRAEAEDSETGLEGTIQIKSQTASYDSGIQTLKDEGNGLYTYIWKTDGLPEASDYLVEVKLKDLLGREALDNSLTINIDNTLPPQGTFVINNGQKFTDSRSMRLAISAKNAVEMYLEGDIVDDIETFEWISFAHQKKVTLIQGDGTKRVIVKFRNLARIESEPVEASIILDSEPPAINLIESQDVTNPEDNDNYYHAGQSIKIKIETYENESGLSGNIRIKSKKANYDSGLQELTDEGDGSYSFLWDTTGLKEERDYVVEATLVDSLERKVTISPITLIIDNTSPTGEITINDNAQRTTSRSVTFKANVKNAVEMYISGDIIDDTNTFEWIPLSEDMASSATEIVLNLTNGTGDKVVKAKFKDKADNESKEFETSIVFIAMPPKISRVDSWAEGELALKHEASYNDEQYHAGQIIKIVTWADEDEAWLLGKVRIKSSAGYNSGFKEMLDEGDGRYTYLWDTTGLAAGKYSVEAVLSDGISNEVSDKSLSINIDNTPPQNLKFEIRNSELGVTSTSSVTLTISAEDAVQMWIEGDVVDDTNTFEWIPFVETLTINLAPEDGKKQISIKCRDAALNESKIAAQTVVLDTTGPGGNILIEGDSEWTTKNVVSTEIEAVDAVEMYLSGDITNQQTSIETWITYASSAEVHLTEGDGTKTVKVKFRDDLGNIGEEVEDTITLDTMPPKIESVNSQNIAEPEDDDGRYHVGDTIKITPKVEDKESGLKGFLRIISETAGYDSGSQSLTEDETGLLNFLWATKGFREAEDYKIEIKLQDKAGNETVDSSLILALVSPSVQEYVTINNGDEYTELASVELQIFSDNAAEMLIQGDLKDDSNSFEWIEYASALTVNLTQGDGEKTIKVTFRDNLQRESGPVEDTIILDTEAPQIISVKSHGAGDDTDNESIYHAGETVELLVEAAEAETGLEGSIRIHSTKVSYDSGAQKLKDDETGEYSYLWDTTGLKEADDYVVEATLKDQVSHQITDTALRVSIDNTPPSNFELRTLCPEDSSPLATWLVDSESEIVKTSMRSIMLEISAERAEEMWIEGDVVDDTNTFEWIPYQSKLVVNLTLDDGEKVVRAKLRDNADNETEKIESIILLNRAPPGIESVDSEDKDNPTDSDEIYHAGQPIQILIKPAPVDETETDLEATVQIKSEKNAYDSGVKVANDDDEGIYSYLWNTSGLKSAEDYIVKVTLQDSLGQKSVDESLGITIDNEAPTNYELRIMNHELQVTRTRSIMLGISAEDVVEMFIEGDVVEDTETFKWIPYPEVLANSATKEVQLTEDDGEKTVKVRFRDAALNESSPSKASIMLDTTGPANSRIVINEGETETDLRLVTLNLFAEDATEMYIDGDVTEAESSFQWIPYESEKLVELTKDDGKKLIGVKYRDEVGNESIRVESSITLDQPGPTSPSIVINDGKKYTTSPTVTLSLSAEDATEMYIDGDVVADDDTFQWISYNDEKQVNLIKSGGVKEIRARFRNGVGNESEQVETSITLDQTAPSVEAVESYDANNPSDDDGIYHPGQIVLIKATAEKGETGLDGLIRIKSDEVEYDSGSQKLTDRDDGSYTYLWQTARLQDAEDYIVEITLKDEVEFTAVDDSLLVTIDSSAPVKPSMMLKDVEEQDEEITLLSRSVPLSLSVEDAVEMFIQGDIINDTNTFQWIPFASEIVVNLAGNDGEKKIKAKFRDAAENESENAEIKVILELKKPELLTDVHLIQPDGMEIAYLVLPFNEPIDNVNKENFYLNLSNPDNPEEQLDLSPEFLANSATIEPVVDENRPAHGSSQVVVQLTKEQIQTLQSWKTADGGRMPDEIWIKITENSVFDLAGNGNLSNEDELSVAKFAKRSLLQQAASVPPEFSPNDDGVKDEVVIMYVLRNDSDVTVKIEDWRGRPIYKWENVAQPKEVTHQLKWDGKKEDGSDCPDGTYQFSVESIDSLTDASVVAKTFSVILDTTPPQINNIKPLSGGQILPTPEISVELIEKSENQAASGIDEENTYVIFDHNPEQTLLLTAADVDNQYTIPSGRFSLESGKHSITFHVADKAGNYTEETAEYTVVETGASPLLKVMNYPNPFKPGGSTTIRYVLTDSVESAVMYIYDASGNLVLLKHMKDNKLEPGEHRIPWNGKDLFGELLTRGVYFCEFRVVTENPENTAKKLHKIAVW